MVPRDRIRFEPRPVAGRVGPAPAGLNVQNRTEMPLIETRYTPRLVCVLNQSLAG